MSGRLFYAIFAGLWFFVGFIVIAITPDFDKRRADQLKAREQDEFGYEKSLVAEVKVPACGSIDPAKRVWSLSVPLPEHHRVEWLHQSQVQYQSRANGAWYDRADDQKLVSALRFCTHDAEKAGRFHKLTWYSDHPNRPSHLRMPLCGEGWSAGINVKTAGAERLDVPAGWDIKRQDVNPVSSRFIIVKDDNFYLCTTNRAKAGQRMMLLWDGKSPCVAGC